MTTKKPRSKQKRSSNNDRSRRPGTWTGLMRIHFSDEGKAASSLGWPLFGYWRVGIEIIFPALCAGDGSPPLGANLQMATRSTPVDCFRVRVKYDQKRFSGFLFHFLPLYSLSGISDALHHRFPGNFFHSPEEAGRSKKFPGVKVKNNEIRRKSGAWQEHEEIINSIYPVIIRRRDERGIRRKISV